MDTFRYSFYTREVKTSGLQVDRIGQGTYGRVYKVYTKRLGVSAAKIFHITGTPNRQEEIFRTVKYEADILALVNHENIVRFHGVAIWSNYFAIIMDYEMNGSLHSLLKNSMVLILPWNLRLRMIFETTKALKFLHNSGIDDRVVHGDLKSSNILLSEDLRIRVGDFGAAVLATKTIDQSQPIPGSDRSHAHTVVFTAPEFLRDVYAPRAKAMDMFSFGRVVYEIITRLTPFQDETHDSIVDDIIGGHRPNIEMVPSLRKELIKDADESLAVFDLLCELMNGCSNYTPDERPSAEDVYEVTHAQMSRTTTVSLIQSVAIVLNQMCVRLIESDLGERRSLNEAFNAA